MEILTGIIWVVVAVGVGYEIYKKTKEVKK